jgi:hypothetical protein
MNKQDIRFYIDMVGDIVEAPDAMLAYAQKPYPSNYNNFIRISIGSQDFADIVQLIKAREDAVIDQYSIQIKLVKLFNKLSKTFKGVLNDFTRG